MFTLFQENTEDKLKVLKIAEELSDKSTLPILRKGLRDISPKVIEISASLIRTYHESQSRPIYRIRSISSTSEN